MQTNPLNPHTTHDTANTASMRDYSSLLNKITENNSVLGIAPSVEYSVVVVRRYLNRIYDKYYKAGAVAYPSSSLKPVSSEKVEVAEVSNQGIAPIKLCIDTVQQATEEGHYEHAVETLKSYYKDFFCTQEDVDDVYIEMLESVEQKLKTVINKKKETAVKDEALADIERFSALYSGLGMREEGLKTFRVHYLEKLMKIESETILELLASYLAKKKETGNVIQDDDDKLLDFTAAIQRLYEFVALFVEEKQPFIEKYFGKENLKCITCGALCSIYTKDIFETLQDQCDMYSSKILPTFIEHYSIPELLVQVNLHRMSEGGMTPVITAPLDPHILTELLDHMAFLIQCSELFDKFMLSRGAEVPKKVLQRQQYTKEITMYYNILEEYFMIESSKKAIQLDQREENSKISSIVDNIFYVLKRCSLRALSTHNVNSACSIINMLANILNIEYRQVLDERLDYSFAAGIAQDHLHPLVLVNNVEVSVEYTTKLAVELEAECKKLFGDSLKELDKIATCLAELRNVSKVFKEEILMIYLAKVCNKLYQLVGEVLEHSDLRDCTYELDDVKFVANEINDPFVLKLIADCTQVFKPYKSSLTESNYASLMQHVASFVATELERKIMTKKFTLLGGLQLDKELKMLQEFFNSEALASVRSKFGRLTQIVSLLNLEKLSDFVDIWNSADLKWKVTEQEAKAVLRRRVDFSEAEIDKIIVVAKPIT